MTVVTRLSGWGCNIKKWVQLTGGTALKNGGGISFEGTALDTGQYNGVG